MWDYVEILGKIKIKTFTAFSSSTKPIISSYKAIRLVRHVFLFVNPCWLLLITILSFMFVNGFRRIWSLTFPGTEVGLAGCGITDLLALLEDRSDMRSVQLSGSFAACHDLSKTIEIDLPVTLARSLCTCVFVLFSLMVLFIFPDLILLYCG